MPRPGPPAGDLPVLERHLEHSPALLQFTAVAGSHDATLVLLSVVVAIAASFTALDLAGRIRAAAIPRLRRAWIATAAVAMGGGIWAMHFVAMLAFVMPMPVSYDPELTVLSLALPILVTAGGFAVVGRPGGAGRGSLLLGGLLMGGGIAAMHYTGMAAMRMPAELGYDWSLVATSVLIAMGASFVALWLSGREAPLWQSWAAAVSMGFAISAMHYVAMMAARFAAAHPHATATAESGAAIGQAGMAVAVAGTTFFLLLLALTASAFDRRMAQAAEREVQALRRSEERFRALYRLTPLPLHALDAEGRILQVSDAWLALMGARREEVLGRRLSHFLAPGTDGASLPAAADLTEAEYAFVTSDGRILSVLLSARVERDAEGRFLRSLGGMVDVTARRRAEEELRHAQKMEAVGQLTGGVAHDFNNLLTAILGSLAMLERYTAGEERATRLLEAARQATRRGAQLSHHLLAFARRQPLRTEPVDSGALLRESATLIRRALGETVALTMRLDPGLPPCRADAAQLQAAVLNLVLNARDAMAEEGGTLAIGNFLAELNAVALAGNADARPGAFVAISVRDTGSGMAPEVMARVFEPFFTTKEVGKGTGLGLSQVYGFVRQLGGHVTLESWPGQGTTVTLWLPVDETGSRLPHAPPEPDEASPAGPPAAEHLPPASSVVAMTSATVLVVEDEAAVLEATAALLREAGWRVVTSQDAPEALAVLEGGEAVDVLFSDVVMPGGMSGVELARIARRLQPGLGVLLTSGYRPADTTSEEEEEGERLELIPKPYERGALLARLDQVLRRARPGPDERDPAAQEGG
jgi:PAS domain S-box-containing protein